MRFLSVFILLFMVANSYAQQGYEVSRDNGGAKILKGIITKDIVAGDTAFTWFQQNAKGYTPNADAVAALKRQAANIQLVVFGGTWCDDTKNLLPKFYLLMEAAGINDNQITLIGVDRSKKTLGHLTEAFGITNVPTFIVMKAGKELGRVIEYGKTGAWDKELGDIVAAAQ
jgi:thiol-disulfide isomerase/thioredoxin